MKLIAVNIDNQDSNLEQFNQMYNETKEQDIALLVISNKQYSTLSTMFKDYENMYILTNQGALLAYNNKLIEKNTFSEMEVVLIVEDLLELDDMVVCVNGVNKAYLQNKDSKYYDEFHSIYETVEMVDNFEEIDDQVINFVGYVNDASEYLDKCSDVMFVDCKVMNHHMIHFGMEDVSVDNGIESICRKMNISRDDVKYFEGNNALDNVMKVLKQNKVS